MDKNLKNRILTGIDKAIRQSLNEAAGTIYNDNWEKFLYAFFQYVREYFYQSHQKQFTVPKKMFEDCNVPFPGKDIHDEIKVKIINNQDAEATWCVSDSTLEIDESIIQDEKYCLEVIAFAFAGTMIHEFTHGINLKNMINKDKYINNRLFTNQYVDINTEDVADLNFVQLIKNAIYYYRKTEQNARISECGHDIAHTIQNYWSLYQDNKTKKLNIDELMKMASYSLKINKMMPFYTAFENGQLGSYEKYMDAQKIINRNYNDIIDIYNVNRRLGEIGDIVSLIIWSKKNKKQFMFFKTNADVFNIKNENDYQKVYNMFLQQTKDELDNFKKRSNKVIWAQMQNFYDKQVEAESKEKVKKMQQYIHDHKNIFNKIKSSVVSFVHKII